MSKIGGHFRSNGNIGFEKVNEKSARKINFGTLIFVVGQSKLTICI